MPRTELDTRLIPYQPAEVSYANNRAPEDRPLLPKPGDRLLYRRDPWEQDPIPVVVLWVQDPDDTNLVHVDPNGLRIRDPNLWHLVRDQYGAPLFDGDEMVYVRHPDPWPQVRLRGVWATNPGMKPQPCEAVTRESRMRGSPGWLPLDWRDRPVRLPGEVFHQPIAPAFERYLAEKAARLAKGG